MVAESHSPMYLAQKYWARKPHNVVREYIRQYSKSGSIVLDPFCGSGVTGIEALILDRKAVVVDLNPLAVFLTKTTLVPVDLEKLEITFNGVEQDVKDEIMGLYRISCPECHSKALTTCVFQSYVVSCPECGSEITMKEAKRAAGKRQNIYLCTSCTQPFSYANTKILREVPVEIRYECQKCGSNRQLKDIPELQSNVSFEGLWYPDANLLYPTGRPFLTKRRAGTMQELFTMRNLYALALLFRAIQNSICDMSIRNLLNLAFIGAVPQSSRMMILTESSGPSWKVPEYLVYPTHCEFNVWTRYENRYKALLRAKRDADSKIYYYKEAKNFQELREDANFLALTKNAIGLTNGTDAIPENSVDYVFTDPPYGGSIQYYELEYVKQSWLANANTDFNFYPDWWEGEITVNKAQQKNFDYYHKMLSAAFKQTYQVIRPGHWMTVTFHNTDVRIWNSIIDAIVLAGFDIEKIVYQPPVFPSAKAQLQPYGSAIGDYYIRCARPEIAKRQTTSDEIDRERYKRVVVETTKKTIAGRGEPTAFTHILNGIITELKRNGLLFSGAPQNIESVLQEYLDSEFVLVSLGDNATKGEGKAWWFKDPAQIPYLEQVPLYERVEKAVINILNRKVEVSFDEVLKEIFLTFPNARTPDKSNIVEVIQEYASKTKQGRWRLNPIFTYRHKEHSRAIFCLALIGKKLGYKIWVGLNEQSDSVDKTVLRSLCSYKNLALPGITGQALKRIKNIDLLWYTDEINAEFEVENSTGITEAVVRGANIPYKVNRYIVIPEERERLLLRRIQEPALKELLLNGGWEFIFYTRLFDFFDMNKHRKTLMLSEFNEIVGEKSHITDKGQRVMF